MKRFVTAVGYFFLAFALIFLEQLPTVFIRANQPFNQTLGITLALLVVSIFTIYVARRVGFLNGWLALIKTVGNCSKKIRAKAKKK